MGALSRFKMVIGLNLLFVAGCSNDEVDVPGRVAIEVTLTIDGQPAESGTLVLRPSSQVACPLVKLEISDGKGALPSEDGPVPGQWTASFRSEAAGSLTDQLEGSGRSNPLNQTADTFNGDRNRKSSKPPKPISVSIPDDDPAIVKINMVGS